MLRGGVVLGALAVSLASLGLASCGGGGGGGGGGSPSTGVTTPTPPTPTGPTANFASWTSDLKPGATIIVAGRAQEITFSVSGSGAISLTTPTAPGAAFYTETSSSTGAVTGIKVSAPNREINFATSGGDTITTLPNGFLTAISSDKTRLALAADPLPIGWNYQSFGVWITGADTSAGSVGAVSIGAATAASAVPTTGTSTFTGAAGGIYLDTTGIDHLVVSGMTLATDFTARRATFTSQSMVDSFTGETFAGTNMGGALTYAAGQNALSGTLTTGNGRLSGTATGQFFGPVAQEVGGLFILTPTSGSGVERLGGGFGGKR